MEFLELVIYMVILKTYYYMEETGRKNSFERFPYLRALTERIDDQALERREVEGSAQAHRYRILAARLGEDDVLTTALDLSLAAMHVPEFGAYLNYYTGNRVTIQLAFELQGVFCPAFEEISYRLKQIQKICRVDRKKGLLLSAELEGENELYAYLTGSDIPPQSTGALEYFSWKSRLHRPFIREELIKKGTDCLRKKGIWQISGAGGRRFLAKCAAKTLKMNLLIVDLKSGNEIFETGVCDFFMRAARIAFLWEAIVCVGGITKELLSDWKMTETQFFKLIALPFVEADHPLILCTDGEVRFLGEKGAYILCSELEGTTRREREILFDGFSKMYDLNVDCARSCVCYPLSANEIAYAVDAWRSGAQEPEAEDFSRICRGVLRRGERNIYGEVLYPSVGFSDLKLPEDMHGVLRQICTGATEGHVIFEQWNLKRRYPYGRAVTALLAGAPGTGKTMTAHALAKELRMPLYQVDLSAVMDKYIGETEKHLEQAFSFAQKTNMLLFFDEADSLFGKRGEVVEGRDRYANMEVSYILQRIERFEGVVVLATNFYDNIDKAFLRRMRYVLKYQMPDPAMRRRIWQSCLPDDVNSTGLDLDYLAGQFEFSGGMIKNVTLNACIAALYEKTPLRMEHVLRAISAEYEKMEQNAGADIWGEYGYLINF